MDPLKRVRLTIVLYRMLQRLTAPLSNENRQTILLNLLSTIYDIYIFNTEETIQEIKHSKIMLNRHSKHPFIKKNFKFIKRESLCQFEKRLLLD